MSSSKVGMDLDRRWIYLLVLLAISLPLLRKYSVPPARMSAAEKVFEVVESTQLQPGDVAFVAIDFGPGMVAESLPQAEAVVEHLMRRRIPVVFWSLYVLAEPFLDSVPQRVAERLGKEYPGQSWEYGRDWVNLGYRAGGGLLLQSIPKSENLLELFKRDARGNNLADLPALKDFRRLEQIKVLGEFTGLQGMLDAYIQFFQKKGFRLNLVHGCTSIATPEAFVYLDSGQIVGLLEGIAGAAWYSELLGKKFPARLPDSSGVINTGLGIAHIVIIFLIVVGNLSSLARWWRQA
ncbi:MAG: hypothetical protein K1X79_03590 [Oligoflexia bacterium]|nr:hypothetical protein [Oligoflexia bacterium]